MGQWSNCGACAGDGGNGPVAAYSMSTGISNPSMDGSAAQFYLAGGVPWAAALWWEELTPASSAHNFVYDLYFYIENPGVAQALEFDINQAVGGYKYIFGTQCDIKGGGTWDVWNGAGVYWVHTGIPCSAPAANQWHHLVEQFSRDDSGNATFVSISLDGNKQSANFTYPQIRDSGNELNVAFQEDQDGSGTAFSTWLNQVQLSYW